VQPDAEARPPVSASPLRTSPFAGGVELRSFEEHAGLRASPNAIRTLRTRDRRAPLSTTGLAQNSAPARNPEAWERAA